VRERAVVEFGTQHAGAHDQRDQRHDDVEPETDQHGRRPLHVRHRCRVGDDREDDEHHRQHEQRQEAPPAEEPAGGDRRDGRVHAAPTR
jgi:hypothetical protein